MNAGRFIDRNPDIRAAGLPVPSDEGIKASMRYNPSSELAEVWVKSFCPSPKTTELFPSSPVLQNDGVCEIMTPELKKSHFVKFKEQFFEDLYLKKAELGKARDVHSKPDGMNNESRVFGKSTQNNEKLYEVVLPLKTVSQVNKEYIDWHNKYLISHKHFLPGEKLHRNYNEQFKPTACFGKKTNVDKTGRRVKCCMSDHDTLVVVKDLQKYYLERNFGDIGSKIAKFKDPHVGDQDRIFGKPPNSDKCTTRDIIHNLDPSEKADDLIEALAYLNHQRLLLHRSGHFHIFDLEQALEKRDKEKTGYVLLSTAFNEARRLNVFLNEKRMRKCLIFFDFVEDIGLPTERIKIDDFSKTLQYRFLLPEKPFRRHIPAESLDTTYRELCRDWEKPPPPIVPHLKKREEPDEDCSSPQAFAKPRDKEQLKRIFADIVTAEGFDCVWEKAREKLKPENDLMSINEFRAELKVQRERNKEIKLL